MKLVIGSLSLRTDPTKRKLTYSKNKVEPNIIIGEDGQRFQTLIFWKWDRTALTWTDQIDKIN